MQQTRSGFTLVELLITIVIIGILAAIALVAYNGIQGRAQDAAVYSDMHQFAVAVENFRTINGSYPASLNDLATLQVRATTDVYSTDYDNFAYCVRNPGTSSEQFAVGGLSRSMHPYYDYSVEGLTPHLFTGSIDGLLADMCAAVMGGQPDFDALGLIGGTWQSWVNQ